MRTLYIVKTGSTFPAIAQEHGDFEDWIADGLYPPHVLPAERLDVQVIDAQTHSTAPLAYPDPHLCAGIIISGSHDMVTEQAPWMQHLQQWLLQVCHTDIPVLGICFGHQMLAHALGGQVGVHSGGLEIGTVPVAIQADVESDPLWKHMPNCFDAQVVHYQTVLRLPDHACALAGNSHEPHQAFRWRNNVWGVQFHPEFSASAMRGYIEHVAANEDPHGLNATSTRAPLSVDTPESEQLLYYFGLHVQQFAQHTRGFQRAA